LCRPFRGEHGYLKGPGGGHYGGRGVQGEVVSCYQRYPDLSREFLYGGRSDSGGEKPFPRGPIRSRARMAVLASVSGRVGLRA